jgi:hypothetical protein
VLGDEERIYIDPRPAFHGLPLSADDASATKAVAARLEAEEPRGTLVVAGWPGYAVTLYAGRWKDKVPLVHPEPPAERIEGRPAAALLVRHGPDLAADRAVRRQWERALGARLSAKPAWVSDGWAYYPAQQAR